MAGYGGHASETLPFVPKPQPGEHVLGYIRRLCVANEMPSMREFWLGAGFMTMTPNSEDRMWRTLGAMTGLNPKLLDLLRRPFIGDCETAVSILGQPIRKRFLVDRHLRHCPDCTRENGVLQPEWSIYHVTACHRHGAQLQDTCQRCGERLMLFSKSEIWACTHCGTDIRTAPAKAASAPEVEFSRFVRNCIDGTGNGTELHPDLAGLGLDQIVTLADRLGKLAVTAPENDPPARRRRAKTRLANLDQSGGVAGIAAATRGAAEVMQAWPEGYHKLLEGLVDRWSEPLDFLQ